MDLTEKVEYLIKFCMKLIAVTSHDNYWMSYIILRGRWFHIIVLNVHAPTVDNICDVKDSFISELCHI
jgi:hypothetical protein